jgi:hypothetical protein
MLSLTPPSRVESIIVPPSYDALAALQDGDDELQTLLGSTTALWPEKLPIPGTAISIYCDDVCWEFSTIRSSSPTAPRFPVHP